MKEVLKIYTEYKEYKNPELLFDYRVYSDGTVIRENPHKVIKPYKDKRRPNEQPCFYFKRIDGTREFWYCGDFIATLFFDNYDGNIYHIHFKDGNNTNISVDNMVIYSPIESLRNKYGETSQWLKVYLPDVTLYYDYYICEDGRLYNGTTDSFVVPFEDKRLRNDGYLRYNLYYGKNTNDIIHMSASRLVAMHFITVHPANKDVVMFNDNNPKNIHYKNLSWGDRYDVPNKRMMMSRDRQNLYTDFMGEEKWKKLKIPSLELYYNYSVSNYGRIYNDDKKFFCTQISAHRPNLNNQDYQQVNIKTKDKGYITLYIHRLVALAFIKNDMPEYKTCINHINGNPECNLVINLEWCTPYENMHHAIETNLVHSPKYKNHITSKKWRLNTIMAWIYAIPNMTDSTAYKLYTEYLNKYTDDIDYLSFDDYINIFNDKLTNDNDFKTIYEFYKSNYYAYSAK